MEDAPLTGACVKETKHKTKTGTMKTITSLIVALTMAFFAVTSALAETKKEKVNFSDLPGMVQKTVLEYSKDATLDNIQKETEDGTFVCYIVTVKRAEVSDEFYVAEDGKYLGKDKPKTDKPSEPIKP